MSDPVVVAVPAGPARIAAVAPAGVVVGSGVPGVQGPQGPTGATGAQGPTGATGAAGAAGAAGVNGWSPVFTLVTDAARRVLQVSDWVGGSGSKPSVGVYVGASGLTAVLASAVDVRGATGAAGSTGSAGAAGNTVLSGTGAPSSGLGVNGDFYIDRTPWAMYGPKTAGAWGSSTSLVGPQGPTGATGSTGATGAAGQGVPAGGSTGQVLAKTSNSDYATGWATPGGGGSGMAVPAWVSGRYYTNCSGAQTSGLVGRTQLWATPIYVPNAVTVDSLYIYLVTTGSGGTYCIGMYDTNASGLPGALVAQTALLTPATGFLGGQVGSGTGGGTGVAVAAGWYWVGGAQVGGSGSGTWEIPASSWEPPLSMSDGTVISASGWKCYGYQSVDSSGGVSVAPSGATGLPAQFTGAGQQAKRDTGPAAMRTFLKVA